MITSYVKDVLSSFAVLNSLLYAKEMRKTSSDLRIFEYKESGSKPAKMTAE